MRFVALPRGAAAAKLAGAADGEALGVLGKLKHREGDLQAALDFYRKSAAAFEKIPGAGKKQKFDYSCALSNVSAALGELGRAEEALGVAESALVLRKTLLGGGHFSVAESLTNIGRILFMLGRINRATESFEEALTLFLAHSEGKEDTPYVAIAYLNVGLAYQKHPGGLEVQGSKAIEKAARLAVLVWGEDHPQTLSFKEALTWKSFVFKNAFDCGYSYIALRSACVGHGGTESFALLYAHSAAQTL